MANAFLDKLSFSKPLYTFSIFVIVFYYLYVIVFMCCMCAILHTKIVRAKWIQPKGVAWIP